MDVKQANKFWQRALKKEVQRTSHHPKAPPHQRWVVPERERTTEPISGRKRDRWMTSTPA